MRLLPLVSALCMAAHFFPLNALTLRDVNLPGLTSVQSNNARAVIARIRDDISDGLGMQACVAALCISLAESGLLNLADSRYPASYDYPYDATIYADGSVADESVALGIFQMTLLVATVAQLMDVGASADIFFYQLNAIPNWQSLDVQDIGDWIIKPAAEVQYHTYFATATEVCNAGYPPVIETPGGLLPDSSDSSSFTETSDGLVPSSSDSS